MYGIPYVNTNSHFVYMQKIRGAHVGRIRKQESQVLFLAFQYSVFASMYWNVEV